MRQSGSVTLTLLSWRREVARLYAEVRADTEPERAWVRWRSGRDELLGQHPDSPLTEAARRDFPGLTFGDYDPAYRFTSRLESVQGEHLDVGTAGDGVVPFERIGRVRLGELGTLDVWWLGSYGGGIFLPLRDGSAGTTSYGGGRYLLDTVKSADLGGDDQHLVLDLNFTYHPSCAYNPAWSCPLAPPGNRLTVEVPVGEHLPPGGWY